MKVNISAGSENQRDWASAIATAWLTKLDLAISDAEMRNDPALSEYIKDLQHARAVMLAGFAKVSAPQIIAIYNRKEDLAVGMIAKVTAKHAA